MIFIGTTFCSGENSLNTTPTNVSDINNITLKNAIVDDLHITKDISYVFTNTPPNWDFDTILYALFEGNLHAGNVSFAVNQCSAIRIKRRKKGDFKWISLFEIPISKAEDFDFVRFDNYARSNTTYEYGCFAVINDVESTPDINEVESKFDGVFITTKDRIFNTLLEVQHNEKREKPTGVIKTMGRKYATTIANGESNCYSGSVKATFIELDTNSCEYKMKESWKYREGLDELLCNGQPLILKFDNGQMWLISVVGEVVSTNKGHPDYVETSFNWVEVGDCEDTEDLYNAGLLDYEGW